MERLSESSVHVTTITQSKTKNTGGTRVECDSLGVAARKTLGPDHKFSHFPTEPTCETQLDMGPIELALKTRISLGRFGRLNPSGYNFTSGTWIG